MIKLSAEILIYVMILISSIHPQVKQEWFPADLNIQPFTANVIEPKAGFEFLIGRSELQLNVGISRDIYLMTNENCSLSFGTDFFTYSRLRSERDFHFPVDAIDYLFGINAAYKMNKGTNEYGFRFRLSHISAHFVDGHFDHRTSSWRDGRTPQVYSREFVEIFPFYKIETLRLYAGFTYIFNVTPEYLGKEIYQAGFDYYLPDMGFAIFSPFVAYDFKLGKIDKFSGSNSLVAGLKFGNPDSRGFSIRFSYLSGKSIHGEYFDIAEKYSSIGFNLEL